MLKLFINQITLLQISIMRFEEKIKLLERVHALISRKSTGSPKELARRLNKSERYVFKLVNMMKDLGAPIKYCNVSRSYIYDWEVDFSIEFNRKDGRKILGGKTWGFSAVNNVFSRYK